MVNFETQEIKALLKAVRSLNIAYKNANKAFKVCYNSQSLNGQADRYNALFYQLRDELMRHVSGQIIMELETDEAKVISE